MMQAAEAYGIAYKSFAAKMKCDGYCKAAGKSFTVAR